MTSPFERLADPEQWVRCDHCGGQWVATAERHEGAGCPACGLASKLQALPASGLTELEERELTHWRLWGSDGYPVEKVGREWAIPHFPVMFKTRRAAVAQWERYIDALIDRKAGRR